MEDTNISNTHRSDNSITSFETQDGYETLAQKNENDTYELSILVSGVHCAACIQKIESSLAREQDVEKARLNFSTRRLSLVWRGVASQANDYVRVIESLGYGVKPYDPDTEKAETRKEERFLLLCLGVAGFAMGNIMLLSVGVWSTSAETMGMATRGLMHWVSAGIALPAILFSGRPFFRSALKALSNGQTNMDVPISLALFLAAGMSLFETLNHGEHVYFDSAVMLMFFLLIGRYLDFRARKNARSTATDLLGSLNGFANVVEGDHTKRVLVRDINEGMIVRVAAGEKFPVDGVIIDGMSSVDTSLVTGETLPREININSEVYAGTLNLSASVLVKTTKAAESSLLADIVKLMEKAGQGQAKYVRLSDKAAQLYTPVVHIFAVLAFVGWFYIGGLMWQDSLMIAITVLIITCPCALGLAVPVVQVLASGRLMKKGILVKAGDALERLAQIDMLMLDKTGTLTVGKPVLIGEYDDADLQIAASIAFHSRHPLSQALVNAYDGALLGLQDVQEHSGKGLEALYNGKNVKLGSRLWCGDKEESLCDDLEICMRSDDQPVTAFYFSDQLRADVKEIIKKFKDRSITPIIVSGDRPRPVGLAAQEAGIDSYFAEHTPKDKFEVLDHYKNQGCNVLMVGDGLNDAPVLAAANVSMAPGSAIDMAQNSADIIFMGESFAPVYEAYRVGKDTQKLVKQNFVLAVLYNIIAIPFALSGNVTPLIAALCMSGSSLVVIANSFRLKWMS